MYKNEDVTTNMDDMMKNTEESVEEVCDSSSTRSENLALNEVRDSAIALLLHNEEVQNGPERDEVNFVGSISHSDANIICRQADEEVIGDIGRRASSPVYRASADVVVQRDYQTLAEPPNSYKIVKAMGMMAMKNRERGSTDGRGKYNTLLGRWLKTTIK